MSNSHPPHTTAALPRPELPEGTSNGVTQDYLDAHNNRLAVTIPHYPGQAVGDSIALSIGGANAKPLECHKVTHTGGSTKIALSGEKLQRVGSGAHLMYYTVTPPSGAEGPTSNGTFIRLFPT